MTTQVDLPAALAARPWDERRKLPVPYVNEFPDGTVDFTGVHGQRQLECARGRLCGLCHEPIGYWVAFLGGPASARLRTYSDPPMHEACAEAATRLCPHLARRDMKRAPDHRLRDDVVTPPGFVDERVDQVVMGITRQYRVEFKGGFVTILPAPWKRLRTFTYDNAGRLQEAS